MSSVCRRSVLCSRTLVRSSQCLSHPRRYTQDSSSRPVEPDHTASSKLFEDAAREEDEEAEAAHKSSVISMLEQQNENWTGDEPMEHAVLRMLVDKYKPLRGGPVRSADEKLRRAPPKVRTQETPLDQLHEDIVAAASPVPDESAQEAPVRRYVPGEPILPGIPGHQPWHTTFTVPSHATSSVRYGNIPPPKPFKTQSTSMPVDDKARRKARETQKRMQQGVRLSQARESTLDYRLGIKGAAEQFKRPNPVSMKGWANLVEDRIEKARQAGHFNNIKGRGQPIAQASEDKNPFIGREEFLMNRIVQRQGAAPPWVEIQGELESAINTFREVLKQSWTRRAIRSLTTMHPASLLPRMTLADVTSMRDPEWENKERAYHDTALEEVNSLVRKYNGLAPYAVRRAYYMRAAELDRVYNEAGEDILRGLEERAREGYDSPRRSIRGGGNSSEEEAGGVGGQGGVSWGGVFGLRDMFREMVAAIRGR
ncbi:hypothetical protein L226DRAFT_529206 [Lentinus tigrinus ALCF2SS1-7]|uniref:DnaJ homologue subfamily C member 28 conserved domain-containing protein n=1 Tax=Lentinus tigrinus ALCF2SS1-6 TaxID=1328759 RepID=A0A5C2ST16_9APHY|nr:hypothetical protein L227DRAFT_537488 [Lentinus tigrinus ALCF2SS1-6]RPD80745.1 hypothetical protein L226DRAFT_529206 [Lentinus tigrinus ALCF2SS1-7]